MSNLHGFDIAVIAAYFLVLAGIGYWAARREKNVSADFFLASRDVGWFAVGASLFASNIGSEHLVGLAGTGAASGLAVGHFEWLACFMLLLLGWLFVPFYLRSGVYTMPEFLERRFNPAARSYFTWVSIIGYVLTKISVTLFAGGIVMREVTGYSVCTSAVILIVVTGLYTVLGGLRAVIYTEVMQAVVLIIGSANMTVLSLQAVGGWSGREPRRSCRSHGGGSGLGGSRPASIAAGWGSRGTRTTGSGRSNRACAWYASQRSRQSSSSAWVSWRSRSARATRGLRRSTSIGA